MTPALPAAMQAFRTPNFLTNRFTGGGLNFGPGSPFDAGLPGQGQGQGPPDEILRRLIQGLGMGRGR